MYRPASEVAKHDRVLSGILQKVFESTTININRLSVFQDAIFIKDGTDDEFNTLERIMREDAKDRGLEVVKGKWRKVR